MTKKIIIFLMLLILFAISITSISAAEFNASGEFIDVQKAINQANPDDTIILTGPVAYNENTEVNLKEGIRINKDGIIIDGKGNTINGNGARIFNITGNKVVIKNVKLINGVASDYGGAIYNAGNYTRILNSTITENYATFGGGIYNDHGLNFIIAKSNITSNTASYGGGIYNDYGNDFIMVETNNINNNNAAINGGGIYNNGGDNFEITEMTNINNNTAAINGGGIYNNGGNNFEITEMTNINNNTAAESGGGIYNYGGDDFKIIGYNNINNNTATYGGGIYTYYGNNFKIYGTNNINNNNNVSHGGGIYNDYGNNFNITGNNNINNNINNNTARSSGGGIYNTGRNFTITGNNNINNNTANNGGGIYNQANNFTITGNNNINNNTARSSGGGIYNTGRNFTITENNNINNNTARSYGGGIYNTGQNFTITGNNNINNNQANNGGGICINNNATIISVNFKNNTANNGSAIYNAGNLFLTNNIMIQNNNKAPIYNTRNITSLTKLIILENKTINLNLQDKINITSILTDDMGNVISGHTIGLKINGNNISVNSSNNITFYSLFTATQSGNFIVTGTVSNPNRLTNLTILNANILVAGNLNLNVSITPGIENATLEITVNNTATGKIQILEGTKLLGEYNINNGKLITTINLTDGNHNLTIKYISNNQIFSNQTITKTVNIDSRQNPNLKATATPGYLNATFNITINNDATGKIQILKGTTVLGEYTITNGQLITVLNLNGGTQDLNIKYISDNQKYKDFTIPLSVTITNNINLIAENINMYYRDGTAYIVTVKDRLGNPIKNTDIIIKINNVTYTRQTNDEGIARMTLNLNPINTTVFAYVNDTKYNITTTLNILPNIFVTDLTKMYKNGSQYLIKVLDAQGNPLARTAVSVNINGIFYNRTTDASGIATLSINLIPGIYIATAEHPTNGLKATSIVTVLEDISVKDLTKFFANDSKYYIKVLDSTGNPLKNTFVKVNINGVFYERETDGSGIATLSINLNPGTYIATAEHPITGLMVSSEVIIKPTLIGTDLTKSYSQVASYEIKVLNHIGQSFANQVVKININGVFYERTSGNDGIARLSINLDPASYIATAEWNGYSTSNTIKVNP